MNIKKLFISPFLLTLYFAAPASTVDDLGEAKKVAKQFIQLIDKNEAEGLKSIMHPDMLQYTNLGDKLIPFKGSDFIQMVADKKLGGKPRKITFKSADIIRGNSAYVVVNAVSEEYDFMYHLSLAKQEKNWVIVGVLVDVIKA